MHRKVAAALVAALALAVASCGGSDEQQLSGPALARRIETVCREAQRRAQARLRSSRSDDETAYVAVLVAVQREISEQLGEIEPADGASSNFDAFKQAMDERTELFERLDSVDRAQLQRTMENIEEEANAVGERLRRASDQLEVEACN